MSDGDVALALIRHVRQTATCTQCKLPFRSPHLLPACLHTFCHQCIEPLITDNDVTVEDNQTQVVCPLCSQVSLVSSSLDGKTIPVKDYFANKLLECTGHLLALNKYGGNYSRVCEFVKKLHDACECPVCQELCCIPRVLPCTHTFCESCLNRCNTLTTNSPRFPRLSKCPLCRLPYSKPANWFDTLPSNKLLSRILDKLSEPEVRQLVMRLLSHDGVGLQYCGVIGVAELHDRLYVLQNKYKSIHVSSTDKPYLMFRDVPLDGVVEPTDLAASTVDSCLYVADRGENGCIWQVLVEERFAESVAEYADLKLDHLVGKKSAQESHSDHGRDAALQNTYDTGTVHAPADESSAAEENISVTDVGQQNHQQPVGEVHDETNLEREPSARASEQSKPVDVNPWRFIDVRRECSATEVIQDRTSLSNSSANCKTAGKRSDSGAGDMCRSLLESDGLIKKISSELGGLCVLEIYRHYTVKRWVEGVRANAVSVGNAGQVILLTDIGHLVIYNVNGQLIVDHSLPDDVQIPRHAVFSSASGTFIVSHSSVDGFMHRVSELIMDPVTSRLYVLRSYGSTAGSWRGHLHWPRHLTVDERGFIFVADCGNDRVLLLDEKLQLRRVMLSAPDDAGVKQPWRICFVPHTGTLVVGSVTGTVSMFDVGGKINKKK